MRHNHWGGSMPSLMRSDRSLACLFQRWEPCSTIVYRIFLIILLAVAKMNIILVHELNCTNPDIVLRWVPPNSHWLLCFFSEHSILHGTHMQSWSLGAQVSSIWSCRRAFQATRWRSYLDAGIISKLCCRRWWLVPYLMTIIMITITMCPSRYSR